MLLALAFIVIVQVTSSVLDCDYAWHSQFKYFEVILVPAKRCFKRDKIRIKLKYPFNGKGEDFLREIERKWTDKRIKTASMTSETLFELKFNELTTLIYRAMIKRGHLLIAYNLFRTEGEKYDIHLTPEICPITPGEYECMEYERLLAQNDLEQKRFIAMKFMDFFQQCHPEVPITSELGILTCDTPISLSGIQDLIAQTEETAKKLIFKAASHYVNLARSLKEKCDKLETENIDLCDEYIRMLPEIPSIMISINDYKRITSFIAKN